MSVLPNTRYRTVGAVLANSSKTDVYTAGPGVYAEIVSIIVCASAGAAGVCTIHWYDVSLTTEYAYSFGDTVPAAGALDIPCYPLHFEPGDILRVTGEAAQHVTITMIEAGKGA